MLVRPYTPKDFAGCLAAFDSNVPSYFKDYERDGFVRFLENAKTLGVRYFVVVDGDAIAACGGVGVSEGDARMCWGIVHGALHRRGIGRFLLATRLVLGAEMGARTASLETIPAAVGFFERLGFRVIGGADDHYGPGLHRRDLALSLDDDAVARLAAVSLERSDP